MLVAGVRRGQPTTPDGGAQLVQPLQLLDEVRVELSRPQRQPADRTAGRVQLELLLAWGTQEIVETEGRVAHTSLVYCITHRLTDCIDCRTATACHYPLTKQGGAAACPA